MVNGAGDVAIGCGYVGLRLRAIGLKLLAHAHALARIASSLGLGLWGVYSS